MTDELDEVLRTAALNFQGPDVLAAARLLLEPAPAPLPVHWDVDLIPLTAMSIAAGVVITLAGVIGIVALGGTS